MILIRHYHQMTCKHKGIFNLLEMKSNLFGQSLMDWLRVMKWIKIWPTCIP